MLRRSFTLYACVILLGISAHGQLSVPYQEFDLQDGLHVILHVDHSVPMVGVNLWYHVGSSREKVGRTGFAHLFEHIMFEGSAHVPLGKFDQWLEAAGGDNNASTSPDRTNYFENVPSNALELALFLESDRMAYLVDSMTLEKVNIQRDVVKNERRESVDNVPYGLSEETILEALYPPTYPYSWPVIGSMADLSAASFQDVVDFFRQYYTPRNASLVIAGDIDPAAVKQLVEKWFKDVPAGNAVPPPSAPAVVLPEEKRLVLEDKVQLPRLYMVWISPKAYAPGDAELDLLSSILAGGKNSRLYKRLVYDMQIAQDVSAFQESGELSSRYWIVATARAGHGLGELEKVIREELNRIFSTPPTQRELQRAVNQFEASFLDRLERIDVKADLLNSYYTQTGNPDYFNEDLERYRAISTADISAMAEYYLERHSDVVLSIVPTGHRELSAPAPEKESPVPSPKGGGK